MKKILSLLLLFGFTHFGLAQRLEDMTNYPTTPQTTALFKTIAAPVSHYTGQPDISIPLYTISQDGVDLPISISFNTSGIFVTEEATSVGLGVSLNWGGSISRSINGSPDERCFFTNPYLIGELKQELPKNYSNYCSSLFYPYCDFASSRTKLVDRVQMYHDANKYNDPFQPTPSPMDTDFRPDDFHYNVLNKSGSFKFNQLNRQFVTFPLDDIKIEKVSTLHSIDKFYITKSDGSKITFGDGAIESLRKSDGPFGYVQTWFVKSIATIKNSTIDFSYITNEYSKNSPSNPEIRVPGIGIYNNVAAGADVLRESMIKTITFEQGKLEFIYANDRSDRSINNLNSNLGDPASRLSKIILFNSKNQAIRTFQFYHSYFTNGMTPAVDNNRLRLDSLAIQDNFSNNIEKYAFEYQMSTNVPSKKSLARDHWGYYNGATNNTTLIPSTVVPIGYNFVGEFNGMSWSGYDHFHDKFMSTMAGNRFVNSATNKIFTLKKIKFPTGGEREYVFEDNDVPYSEIANQMKDISNDSYEIKSQKLLAGGSQLSNCEQAGVVSNGTNTERTLFGSEFNVQDFSDTVLGEPSMFVRTNYVNPAITTSQLNLWAYKIEIGLQKKVGATFVNYATLLTVNRADAGFNMSPAPLLLSQHLPILPDGMYRIFIKMTCPPTNVMNSWVNQYGQIPSYSHNTVVGLTYRKKNFSNIRVGGLRVKDIIDKERDSEYRTTYEYKSSGNTSSGRLVNFPEYKERINTSIYIPTPDPAGNSFREYHGYRICSEAVMPLPKTQGSNVGYTSITKKIYGNSEIIKEDFTYRFVQSVTFGYMKQYYQENEPRPWHSGKLLSNKKYKDGILITEDLFDYYGLTNETDKGLVEEINTSLVQGNAYIIGGYDTTWDVSIENRETNPVVAVFKEMYPGLYYFDNRTDCVFQYNQNNSSWLVINLVPPCKVPYFRSYTGFDKIKSKKTINYYGSDAVSQVENYYYDAVPTHLGMTRQETTNSANELYTTKFYYPQDLASEPFMTNLVSAFRVENPVKTEQLINGVKISEEKSSYSQDATTSNLLLTKNAYSGKFPNSLPNLANIGQLEKKITYDKYDASGNLLQFTTEGGITTSIIWGYNGTLPIAKIENASYDIVSTYLVSNLQSLSQTGTEENLITALNTLRNTATLSGAMVTTFSYKPLVGVSSITDPKGQKTTYIYDSFGRLKEVRDNGGMLISGYDYHYKQN